MGHHSKCSEMDPKDHMSIMYYYYDRERTGSPKDAVICHKARQERAAVEIEARSWAWGGPLL